MFKVVVEDNEAAWSVIRPRLSDDFSEISFGISICTVRDALRLRTGPGYYRLRRAPLALLDWLLRT